MIRIKTKGLKDVTIRIGNLAQKEVRQILHYRLTEMMRNLRTQVRMHVPGSGKLKKFVQDRITPIHKGFKGEIRLVPPGKPYPKFIWDIIIEGSDPHPIVAKGKALRFWWAKMNSIVFFKSVNHPGTDPNDFAAEVFKRVGASNIEEMGKRIVRDVARRIEKS